MNTDEKEQNVAEQAAAESAEEPDAASENDAAGQAAEPDDAGEKEDVPVSEEETEPAPETSEPAPDETDWKNLCARTLADFDNYRKRTSRDREELVKFAASDMIKDLLPTVDNLALALGQAKDADDPFVKGIRLAYDGFLKALKDHGAEPFESVGEELDPNRHEAIATLPSDTVEEGRIANEVKKGWMLNGRLLRAAQVVVSSGKAG